MRDFQAPRMPGHWNESEKTFYNGLISVLEELYAYKIKETDLDKKLKTKIEELTTSDSSKIEWKPLPIDTSKVTFPGTANDCVYCKNGNVVWIAGYVKLKSALASNTTIAIGNMPEGYRPHVDVFEMHGLGGSAFRMGTLRNGEIQISNFSSGSLSNNYSIPLKIEYVTE